MRKELSRSHQWVKTPLMKALFSIKVERRRDRSTTSPPVSMAFPLSSLLVCLLFPQESRAAGRERSCTSHVPHLARLCPCPVPPGCNLSSLSRTVIFGQPHRAFMFSSMVQTCCDSCHPTTQDSTRLTPSPSSPCPLPTAGSLPCFSSERHSDERGTPPAYSTPASLLVS